MEARFLAEVSHATLGLTRKEGNEIVLELLSHYEHTFDDPNRGREFPELYDVDTIEPKSEWLDTYHEVYEAVKNIGLDLDGGWRKVRNGYYPR